MDSDRKKKISFSCCFVSGIQAMEQAVNWTLVMSVEKT
jgi:hypothetical protein